MDHETINIGTWMISSEVNGPGRRLVIWMQGCCFRCPGCLNPEFWDEHSGKSVSVAEIKKIIKNVNGKIEGITFSGGEPMLQAKSLIPLARWIKSQGLGLVSYSGFTYEKLSTPDSIPYARELLAEIDMLIDGPFLQEEKAPIIWRGSRNQQVRFLTERYLHFREIVHKEGTCQAEIRSDAGKMAMTGFFPVELWEKLEKKIIEKKLNPVQEGRQFTG